MNSYSSLGWGERAVSFAYLAPTHTPRPLSPRRAKEGANSHIWPCFILEDVLAVWSVATGQTGGTSSVPARGQIRLLAPFPPRRGWKGRGDRGGIERQKNQSIPSQTKANKAINWNLTPIREDLAP